MAAEPPYRAASPAGRVRVGAAAADAGCVVAGGVLPLAFEPFGYFPVAFASLAALFIAWRRCRTPRHAFLRGWLFGIGMFGAGVSWVYESFAFSNVHGALALVLTAALVGGLALFPAVLGWIAVRVAPNGDAPRMLAVYPAGWVLFEWLRGWVLTGFPWLQLGHAQIDAPASGWLPVVGVMGTSALVAFVAGGLACAVLLRRIGAVIVLAAATALWGAGTVLENIDWARPAGAAMTVAIVQGNVPQVKKWQPEMRAVILERYAALTREHLDADLVVWPETAMPGFLDTLADFTNRLSLEVARHGSAVLSGVPIREKPGGLYVNAVVMLGSESGVYVKRHLVPFGEYPPLAWLLRPIVESVGIPLAEFTSGPREQAPILLGPHTVGVSICYEVAFAREVRRDLPEAAFLVTVSNDAWFGDSIGPHQHLEIARTRAAETGRWLVRATNTGLSAVISPRGEVSGRLPQFETAAAAFEIVPMQGATPYVRFGDVPIVIAFAIWFVSGIVTARKTA